MCALRRRSYLCAPSLKSAKEVSIEFMNCELLRWPLKIPSPLDLLGCPLMNELRIRYGIQWKIKSYSRFVFLMHLFGLSRFLVPREDNFTYQYRVSINESPQPYSLGCHTSRCYQRDRRQLLDSLNFITSLNMERGKKGPIRN